MGSMAGAHDTAQRLYDKFCRNRTAQLYTTFCALAGMPDFAATRFNPKFGPFALPTGGCKEPRFVEGMEQDGRCHGVIRYEYKGSIIEECHMEGREHGLRVVCTQIGQIWLRLYRNGERMAQIVLNGDSTVATMPKPIDEGRSELQRGLKIRLHISRPGLCTSTLHARVPRPSNFKCKCIQHVRRRLYGRRG